MGVLLVIIYGGSGGGLDQGKEGEKWTDFERILQVEQRRLDDWLDGMEGAVGMRKKTILMVIVSELSSFSNDSISLPFKCSQMKNPAI